jgi:hypothetical protein
LACARTEAQRILQSSSPRGRAQGHARQGAHPAQRKHPGLPSPLGDAPLAHLGPQGRVLHVLLAGRPTGRAWPPCWPADSSRMRTRAGLTERRL